MILQKYPYYYYHYYYQPTPGRSKYSSKKSLFYKAGIFENSHLYQNGQNWFHQFLKNRCQMLKKNEEKSVKIFTVGGGGGGEKKKKKKRI